MVLVDIAQNVTNDIQESEKPTLPSFTLAGRVAVVTGGAQGLGLVMSRALVLSGANVALVDLQSQFPCFLPQGSN